MNYDRFVQEVLAVEAFLYEEIESSWTTPVELSHAITQYNELTLNGLLITGLQANELVKLCLRYYRKIQHHSHKAYFREEILDALERQFPDRSEYQIAVVRDPHNPDEWRVRKRLFARTREMDLDEDDFELDGIHRYYRDQTASRLCSCGCEVYFEKFRDSDYRFYIVQHSFCKLGERKLIKPLSQYGEEGCYFYGENVSDPKKIWIDPGAIEIFLSLLFQAKNSEVCVHEVIDENCPEYLGSRWFVIPEKEEDFPRVYVASL